MNNPERQPIQSSITARDIRVVVMAGGRGTRLQSVMPYDMPKDFLPLGEDRSSRGIDRIARILTKLSLNDVIFSANHYYPMYEDALASTDYRLHYQEPGDNHGLDLKKIIDAEGSDKQYLILSTDLLFSPSDLERTIHIHERGTVTRGVTAQTYEELKEYNTMVNDKETSAIVGDTRSSYFTRWDPETVTFYTSGPVTLLDPILFNEVYEIFQRLCGKEINIDLWKDIGFLLAERNRRRISKNKNSFYNICIFEDPMVDYGTPASSTLAKTIFNSKKEKYL